MGLSKAHAGDLLEKNTNESAAPGRRQSYVSSWTPVFVAVLSFVTGVSLYDGYLVVRTGTMIREFELNPVGRYLIDCGDGDVNIFLRVKAAGTLVTLAGLCVLHHHSRRLAGPVEFALVVFQGGLLLFLENPFS
jgi:hypothetical protein